MDPNLRFGISQRQPFVQRFLLWTELLDPVYLFISVGKIENSRQLLLTNEDAPTLYRDDQRIREAWQRSLSTVHPDNSKLIPALFRPAAFMPLVAPLVFLSMMPVKGIKSMILPQVSLYAYTTAFTITNGNASYSHGPVERTLLGTGVCVSSTLFGLIPHFVHMRYGLDNFWIRKALPIAILAQVSGVNVLASRRLESIRGIEVMDKKGNVIGHSRRAGEKAIKETAISRAVLFGTAAFIPEAFMYYLKKIRFSPPNPQSFGVLKLACTLLTMGLMVPASFSIFPQVGRIQRGQLEKEIRSSTEEAELFYNRGV
uniref:sideroflexin-4 isoform X3 n=1 Tax=Jaculus jaculus TaxID=51337 RepID=UPI001E1B0929|nr:sideroflexin-4 isoform X3 [Jaculus jaculus]